MNKGSSYAVLAEQGISASSNLYDSIECYTEAKIIFKREKCDLDYAKTLACEGNVFLTLASQGISVLENLDDVIDYCDEAGKIFKREKSEFDYAKTLRSKGNALRTLSSVLNKQSYLKESVKCFDESMIIFKRGNSDLDYAITLMGKGNSIMFLGEGSVKYVDNLNLSIEYHDEAARIFKREDSVLNYAGALTNKGNCILILAKRGIETGKKIKTAISCFDEASRIFKRKNRDLNYASTLIGKGYAYMSLAECGEEIENNFNNSINNYEEAEAILYEKSSLLTFVFSSLNHCIALLWRYTKTKDEKYLEDAKVIAKKARAETDSVVHPAKEDLKKISIQIYDILDDKDKASEKSVIENIDRKVDSLKKIMNCIDAKTDSIGAKAVMIEENTLATNDMIQRIETSIKSIEQILHTFKVDGVKLKDEDMKKLEKLLLHDLDKANKEQLNEFMKKLTQLFDSAEILKKIDMDVSEEKKTISGGTISNIKEKIKILGKAVITGGSAEVVLLGMKDIMSQIKEIYEDNPELGITLIRLISTLTIA